MTADFPTAPRPAPGDLIICIKNDHTIQAVEPGRTLANGDLLPIDAVADHAPGPPPDWPAMTIFIPNEPAFPPPAAPFARGLVRQARSLAIRSR